MITIKDNLKDTTPYIPGRLKEGAIKLASNENPLGPSPKALETIRTLAGNVSLYPDDSCARLKQKLAEKFNLKPENFIIGNGSDEVLSHAAGAFIDNQSNAITLTPTFSEYAFVVKLFGGSMRTVKMENGRYPLDAMADLVDRETRIIFLCNPNNPTGTYFNRADFSKFLKRIPDTVLIVVDEAYCEYANASDFPDSLSAMKDLPNLLILRTFSKLYGLAGLRVGYGISNASIIESLNKARNPFNVNYLAQEAAIAALDDSDFVKQSLAMNKAGNKYLCHGFDRLGLAYFPSEANFIFVYIKQDCMSAFEKLMNEGVTIRPMKGFGIADAIRVTIGTEEQNRFFIQCLEKIL